MKLFQHHITIAGELADVLNGIEIEMNASLSLNNRAMQSLEVDRNGWCKESYNSEAEKLWADQLKAHPKDPETLHHLAILYQTRAFDLEFSSDPTSADADWKMAAKCWKELMHIEGFWNRIPKALDLSAKDASQVDKVRDRLPERLLGVHFAIAYSPDTPSYRALFHVKLALEAGYTADTVQAVREKIYGQFIATLPDEIWGGGITDQNLLDEACNKIRGILEIDPACIVALYDALRIQERMLRMELHRLMEYQDDPAKSKIIFSGLRNQAINWNPYFETLVGQRNELPDDIKEVLLSWLRYMGIVRSRLEDFSGALLHLDHSILLATGDESLLKELTEDAALTHLHHARDLAVKKSSAAATECRKASARPGQTPMSQFLRAQIYQILDDFDNALIACDQGIELVNIQGNSNSKVDARANLEMARERLQEFKKQLRIGKAIQNAQSAMAKQEFPRAITILDGAIGLGSDAAVLYYWRCQCYIQIKKMREANADLARFDAMASSTEEKKAAGDLRKQIQNHDIEGKYLEPAIKSRDKGEFLKAIELLSKAIEAGYSIFAVYFIRCQCYIMHNNYNAAETDLKTSEAMASDPEEEKAVIALRQQLKDLEIKNKYLEPALKARDKGEFLKAIEILSKAVGAGHGSFTVYFIRCQCYMRQNNDKSAEADFKRCETIASGPEEKQAVKNLKEHLFPAAPKNDAAIASLVDEIFNTISTQLPYGIEGNSYECKNKLKQLIKKESMKWTRSSHQLVIDQFVQALNQEPATYLIKNF